MKPDRSDLPAPETFEAVVDEDAAAGEPVFVVVPGFDSHLRHGPCRWLPFTSPAGVFWPRKGDRAVVVRPADGDPWIASWVPTATEPDVAIGGSTPDATAEVKGKLKLAGDLGGTADLPTVPGLAGKQETADKNQPNGYAGLDGDGKLIASSLPALAITEVWVVVNEAAQLALSAESGDVAIRDDENKSYIHNGGTAGTMADWTQLATPESLVLSVAGKTGAVSLDRGDIANLWGNLKIGAGTPTGGVDGDWYAQSDSSPILLEVWAKIGGTWHSTGLPLISDFSLVRCHARRSTAFSIPNSSWTPVELNVELVDTHAMHHNSTNSHRILIPESGTWDIVGQISWASGGAGQMRAARLVDETGFVLAQQQAPSLTGTWTTNLNCCQQKSGGWVAIHAFQNSGAALNVDTGQAGTWLSVTKRLET